MMARAGEGGSAGAAGAGGSGLDTTVDYLVSDPWHGYLWTNTNGTASIERAGVCATGEVSADYGSWSQLMWNVAQTPDWTNSTWTPDTSSLYYDISTHAGEPRLVIFDEGSNSWCYSVNASTDTVALIDFNSACWDGSGTNYDGATPLLGIQVMVPGTGANATPFDFCVNELHPAYPALP